MRLLIIMLFAISLAGCKTLGGMTYDTSTSNTATDQSQAQNRIDPSLAISATGDSSSYKGSVHDETSTSTDNNNDAASSTGSKNVLGSLDDKSTNINKTQSQTKNATDDDHIKGNQIINDPELAKWSLVASSTLNIVLLVSLLFMARARLIAYKNGKEQASSRELAIYDFCVSKQIGIDLQKVIIKKEEDSLIRKIVLFASLGLSVGILASYYIGKLI